MTIPAPKGAGIVVVGEVKASFGGKIPVRCGIGFCLPAFGKGRVPGGRSTDRRL